jgi:hypothetical protein
LRCTISRLTAVPYSAPSYSRHLRVQEQSAPRFAPNVRQ